jgi:hypothetical protein
MKSMRLKWPSRCGAASLALLLFAALSGGCWSRECAAYGCLNAGYLTGSVVIPIEVTAVDYRLCAGSTCTDASINLSELANGTPCSLLWGSAPKVCLAKTNDSDTFAVSAISSQFPENESPPDITFQLTLVDHVSGGVVLEATRTAKSRATSNDDCHACWTAEATL